MFADIRSLHSMLSDWNHTGIPQVADFRNVNALHPCSSVNLSMLESLGDAGYLDSLPSENLIGELGVVSEEKNVFEGELGALTSPANEVQCGAQSPNQQDGNDDQSFFSCLT